jgi:hypothetical protein
VVTPRKESLHLKPPEGRFANRPYTGMAIFLQRENEDLLLYSLVVAAQKVIGPGRGSG